MPKILWLCLVCCLVVGLLLGSCAGNDLAGPPGAVTATETAGTSPAAAQTLTAPITTPPPSETYSPPPATTTQPTPPSSSPSTTSSPPTLIQVPSPTATTTQATVPISTPTQTPQLPPLDAFMKGFTFADWAPFNLPAPPPPPPGRTPPPARGLYPPAAADTSLENLAATGANWIGLIVVAGQETIASTEIIRDSSATATDAELQHVIDQAHGLGMRVMLRPQLQLYDFPEHWSGQIGTAFTLETQWQEWFTSYRDFMDHYAAFAQKTGVDMLCIGVELGSTTHRSKDWRLVIQEVRERFAGPITYSSLCTPFAAASFPHGEENRINWWDAVDYIGVSAYYNLTDKNDPTVAEIRSAWTKKGHIALLENLAKRFNKPIVFTEIGYESEDGANRWPGWGQRGAPLDLQEQADCYQATLEVMMAKPWLAGIFWFQWFARPAVGGPDDTGYTPFGKPAEAVLQKFYLNQ